MVASIALLATAVPAFGRAAVSGERAETERARIRELAIVRNMVVLSTDVLDELNAAVLADYRIDVGPAPDPEARAAALAELRPMLDGCDGQAELGAAQAAADLAAYENKRARSGSPTGPPQETNQGPAHPNDDELAQAPTANDEITLTR